MSDPLWPQLFVTPHSPPGSSVHGIFQARILEWVVTSYSKGSFWPRDQTPISCVSCIAKWILYYCATWEAHISLAATAKSRQSCPTLCDPISGSPPGSHLWDSPGKNTGVGCHFLPQCMKVKSESEVAQSCPTLCDTMDCSLPGSAVHGISQARVLEWVSITVSVKKTLSSLIIHELEQYFIPFCFLSINIKLPLWLFNNLMASAYTWLHTSYTHGTLKSHSS